MSDWRKSSRCGGGDCVEWRKSSRSGKLNCVEVATNDIVQVRDSKDPQGPVLSFTPKDWQKFLGNLNN